MFKFEWNTDAAMAAMREDGFAQGISQGIEKTAGNMIRKGMTFEIIHEVTDLTLERIKEIAKTIE